MDKFDWFKNEFENNISKEEQIEIFNKFCEVAGLEDEIYPMYMFDEIFSNYKPLDIFHLTLLNKNEVNWGDEYFVVTIYGFKSFNEPYDFIQDYLGDIFNRMDVWETRIDIDDYINDMYDNYFNLKPEDMDDDKFYDIVEDAVLSSDFESDIVNDIKKNVSEK